MEELLKHYVDLLIIQYRTKMKAKATIEALVQTLFADNDNNVFLIKLQNAYDLDTAHLTQLNVLAKYIGYGDDLRIISNDYLKLSDTEGNDETPGLSDADDQYVGYPLLTYSGYTYNEITLSGLTGIEFFRKVLLFLVEMKNKELSLGNLDTLLYKYFGNDLYVKEGVKEITYVYSEKFLKMFNLDLDAIETFIKKYMPRPMGCGMNTPEFEPDYYMQFTINTSDSYTYTINYDSQYGPFKRIMVQWGDGTSDFYDSISATPSHIYSQQKDYKIRVISLEGGALPAIIFGNQYRPDIHSNALVSLDFNNCYFQHAETDIVTRFDYWFCNCTNLVSVDKHFFQNCKDTVSFYKTFYNCGLTEIPKDLFKDTTKAYIFEETFAYNTDLEEIPDGLFEHLEYTQNPNFSKCFYDRADTNKCKLNSRIFCKNNEKAKKFKNVVPNFYLTFSRGISFIGQKGTAPDLWNYTYKSMPNGRNCFLGQSTSTVTNYSNIPNTWGGN